MYRGLNIIHSRSFSMEEGAPPRDVLRRRVRVAEYYRIPWEKGNVERSYGFYDESKDAWHKIKWTELMKMAGHGLSDADIETLQKGKTIEMGENKNHRGGRDGDDDDEDEYPGSSSKITKDAEGPPKRIKGFEIVVIRPNIEHNMLGIIMGRGGLDELGATFWGQTELSCYDDSMHGIWGMSYKYNEKAIVINNKNLIRLWDVAYDGYNGGKDCTFVNWDDKEDIGRFKEEHTYENNRPYEGKSMMVMAFPMYEDTKEPGPWPSPILFHDSKLIPAWQLLCIMYSVWVFFECVLFCRGF